MSFNITNRVNTTALQRRMIFVVVIICIYWLMYFTYASMNNVAQDFVDRNHLAPKVYPWLIITSERITLFAVALCMLGSLQSIHRQRWIFIGLLITLAICLCIPFSLDVFPLITGIESITFTLIEPWLQLYIPPALRATISAMSTGFTGVFDIISAEMEDNWMTHLFRFRYFAVLFALLAILFWRFSNQKKLHQGLPPVAHVPKSVIYLLTKHPYIFIAYFIAGVNSCLFDFTYILAKEVLPNVMPSNYQNTLYLGSIIIPIGLGMLADKKGIFNIMLKAAIALILVNFIAAILFKLSIQITSFYFILAFLEGGLAISAATLSASLIGERLQTHGIFRSFAMSGMLFSVGYLCAGRIYEFCAGSFALTKVWIGICNLILLVFLWKSYRHDPAAANPDATE